MQILQLKSSASKTSLGRFNSRLKSDQQRLCNLKNRGKWKKNKQSQGLWEKTKWSNIYVIGVPEGKESENRAKKNWKK